MAPRTASTHAEARRIRVSYVVVLTIVLLSPCCVASSRSLLVTSSFADAPEGSQAAAPAPAVLQPPAVDAIPPVPTPESSAPAAVSPSLAVLEPPAADTAPVLQPPEPAHVAAAPPPLTAHHSQHGRKSKHGDHDKAPSPKSKKHSPKAPPKHHGHHAPPPEPDVPPPAPPAEPPYGGEPPAAPAPDGPHGQSPPWPFPWPRPAGTGQWPPLLPFPAHRPPLPAWPWPHPGNPWTPTPPSLHGTGGVVPATALQQDPKN